MSSDFEAYEQDFGTITAEVTNKIGRIPKLSGEEKTQLVLNVDKQLEEVRELLEQMDLEVREIPIQSRPMYNSRLKSYKGEIEKLEKDFRAHLLDNTEKLERSSRRLEAGYQIAVETDQFEAFKNAWGPGEVPEPQCDLGAVCVASQERLCPVSGRKRDRSY
ncbi:Vesicle transport through interaction with t-SNAREs like 1A [Dissostichus eleginoides]|uniref:Vesicle transport through interaction with t-SNAREs like 1A n=1 Tax=Dissostichus eleginoides TaxID=100907 RepID=A0AAD9BCE6_DISEL|nr:Vesicle transport through interaction with t-SNAREs like 1A [Dissostichus eleginoides]